MSSLKEKIKANKALIIKCLELLLIITIISLVTLCVLFATKVLYYDGSFTFNKLLFDSFMDEWYGFILFVIIQTVLSMLLCVIPGIAAAFVVFSTVIFPNPVVAFLFSYLCVIISSTSLYIIGRKGGYKVCEKMLGKEDCEKSLELLRTRGTVYFPLMMLFPIFPDDALVMVAGVTKMKLSWFIPSIVLCRGVGAATIVFGISIIPFERFTSIYDWIVLITVCVFWLMLIFKAAHKIDLYYAKKMAEKKQKEESEKEQ